MLGISELSSNPPCCCYSYSIDHQILQTLSWNLSDETPWLRDRERLELTVSLQSTVQVKSFQCWFPGSICRWNVDLTSCLLCGHIAWLLNEEFISVFAQVWSRLKASLTHNYLPVNLMKLNSDDTSQSSCAETAKLSLQTALCFIVSSTRGSPAVLTERSHPARWAGLGSA